MFGKMFRSISATNPKNSSTLSNSNKPSHNKAQLLPNEISSKILELEMQCQKQSISKQIVVQLIALYTKAIEFYEEQGNQKYKLYQRRMQNFLSRPMIQQILRGKPGQRVIKKQKKIETLREAEDKAQNEVKRLIKNHEQREKKQSEKINSELSKQEQVLEERIRKKRAMSNRSIKSVNTFDMEKEKEYNNAQSGQKMRQKINMKQLLMQRYGESKGNKKVFF